MLPLTVDEDVISNERSSELLDKSSAVVGAGTNVAITLPLTVVSVATNDWRGEESDLSLVVRGGRKVIAMLPLMVSVEVMTDSG